MHAKEPLAKPLHVALIDREVVCLGEGAVNFSMTLEAAALTARALIAVVEAAKRQSAAQTGQVILLVEDEPLIRIQVAEALGNAGYRVIEAADAAEALLELENGLDIRLVFTDVNMPGSLNGLELARLVSRRWPAVLLLVTSGLTELAQHDLPPGGRFMRKPYAFREMLRHVRELTAH